MSAKQETKQRVRKGTHNKGQEYEESLPAAIFWNLIKHPNVLNFEMSTNVQNFGLFDDLIIWISKNNLERETFAFQLKHKDEGNTLLNSSHLVNSKDFGLEKYSDSFTMIPQKDNLNCIMYTNACFHFGNIKEKTLFQVDTSRICPGQEYFFLPGKRDQNVYTFQENESTGRHHDFLKKFSFYTGQRNWKELQHFIVKEFKDNLFDRDETVARHYQHFFKEWKHDQFSNIKLTKEEIILQIIDKTLSSFIIKPVISEDNKHFRILEEALKQFKFSITKDLDEETLSRVISGIYVQENENILWLAKNDKFLTKDVSLKHFLDVPELRTITKHKIGYYRRGQPIIVNITEANKAGIVATLLKFPKETNQMHFLLRGKISQEDFPGYTVFKNLNDLLTTNTEIFKEMAKQLKIKLLDKEYSYEELYGDDEEVAKQITIKEICEMLAGTYRIMVPEESLSEPYIERIVSTTLIKARSLDNICKDIWVIGCADKTRNGLKNKNVMEVEEYLKHDIQICESGVCYILFKNREITREILNQICEKDPMKNVHYLKEYNDHYLEWIWSKGSINEVKKCEIVKEYCVKETHIHEHFQDEVNVIISQPGMGKSEMMKRLYILCPQGYFPIKINLKEHNLFFTKTRKEDEILDYCMKQSDDFLLNKTIAGFLQKKKMLFLFDGIDELYSAHVERVLNSIKQLSLNGFRLWVSSRPSLLQVIEDNLNVFSIEIKNFSDRDQVLYLKRRLKGKYKKIDETVERIRENIGKILENRGILDVPLQLFMITEILIQNPDKVTPNMFVVSKMFQYFITGKYRHFFEKRKCNHLGALDEILSDSKSYRLGEYKIAALKLCFSQEEFQSLNLRQDAKFVEQIRREGDFLGISSVSNGAVIFNHNINAEYFGALYLAENCHNMRSFLEMVLFKQKYGHIKLMFDMILAENCPGHIAILYRNIDEFRKCDNIDQTDKGGRNTLHLVCSHACKYPIVNEIPDEINDYKTVRNIRETDNEYKQVLYCLLHKQGLSAVDTVDSLFKWNAFDYIDRSFFLLALDVILEQYGNIYDISKLNILSSHPKTVLYYSALLGYQNLFREIFPSVLNPAEAQNVLLIVAATSDDYKTVDFLLDNRVNIGAKTSREERNALHLSSQHGHLQIVAYLLFKDETVVHSLDIYKRTPLHLAAANGHLQIVKELFRSGAQVDPIDKYGRTPLHLAVQNGHYEIIKFLVDVANADIDKAAFNGWTSLHFAVVEGYPHIVRLLLEKNASFDKFDMSGTKPLHIAAKRRNIEIIEILLNLSKNIEEETTDHRTCLHLAAEFGHLEVITFLLDKGANINAVDGNGKNVLHWAVLGEGDGIIDLLLKQEGIDINARDHDGRSSLHWAAERGHFNTVQLLVKRMASINEKAKDGSTALHLAARKGHNEVVSFLLENRANFRVLDAQGKTPLDWAILENRFETKRLLQNWA